MNRATNRRNWSKSNVPLELWTEILSYLPVKSLIRFRSVCKTWKSMIDDPDFVHLHVKRFPGNASDSRIVFMERNCRNKDVKWLVRRSDTLRKTLELEFPAVRHNSNPDEFWLPAGAVDGIFLLHSNIGLRRKGPIMLWNPSIRKTLLIPDPPSLTEEGGFHERSKFDLCLGFDPSNNDHKVLLIVYPDTKQPIPPSSVDIFSVKERSWQRLEGCGGAICVMANGQKKISVGGSILWIGLSYPGMINHCLVSFNLTTQVFSYSPLPVHRNSVTSFVVGGPSSSSSLGLLTKESMMWTLETSSAATGLTGSECCPFWTKRHWVPSGLEGKYYFM